MINVTSFHRKERKHTLSSETETFVKSEYVLLLLYETKTGMLEKKSRVIKRLFSIATQVPIIPFTLDM